MSCRLLILVMVLSPVAAFSQGKAVETTVCAIATHPAGFHNKVVRFRAKALSGPETAVLVEIKDGKEQGCGPINLDFHAMHNPASASEFLRLFGEQLPLTLGAICLSCPRYNIVATFTGRLLYSGKQPGGARFGHLGLFTLQLNVLDVSALDVIDTLRPVDERVAALIEKMLDENTEQQAFADLEALDCRAVPAIVKRMDDRRALPDPRISLRNKSLPAFEGLRHYAPQKVVDALAAILNQVTGQSFGFIYNGASDAERAKTVRGWRDFVRRTPAEKLCTGG